MPIPRFDPSDLQVSKLQKISGTDFDYGNIEMQAAQSPKAAVNFEKSAPAVRITPGGP